MRHFLLLAALITSPVVAQDQPEYLDDRSTAEALISSYYNAIDRKEYARAYSYFGQGAAPDYESWKNGYADTESVAVGFGETTGEGAAGSTYYSVPVTLEVARTGGISARFAGCYTLRMAQPSIQEPPFQGIHIEGAKLHEAKAGDPPPLCEQ
jgi:hypothetical protein